MEAWRRKSRAWKNKERRGQFILVASTFVKTIVGIEQVEKRGQRDEGADDDIFGHGGAAFVAHTLDEFCSDIPPTESAVHHLAIRYWLFSSA